MLVGAWSSHTKPEDRGSTSFGPRPHTAHSTKGFIMQAMTVMWGMRVVVPSPYNTPFHPLLTISYEPLEHYKMASLRQSHKIFQIPRCLARRARMASLRQSHKISQIPRCLPRMASLRQSHKISQILQDIWLGWQAWDKATKSPKFQDVLLGWQAWDKATKSPKHCKTFG